MPRAITASLAGDRPPIAVIGGGWAGLSAAVRLVEGGAQVSLFETSRHWGGRARSDQQTGQWLDNGQHILIGAYRATLDLMHRIGVQEQAVLHRCPLQVRYADGTGLSFPPGPPDMAFLRAVAGWKGLSVADRLLTLWSAASWRLGGFSCPSDWTVADLCRQLPRSAWRDLLEPLTVAALNTPAELACGQTLLTVLKEALTGPRGSADLLLPKRPLHEVLPQAAINWLQAQGAELLPGQRVISLRRNHSTLESSSVPSGDSIDATWQVETASGQQAFDGVILACTSGEARRLTADINPAWSTLADGLNYQPIITLWVKAVNCRWPAPMMAFRAGPQAPVQFGFDLGQLGCQAGSFSLVISGASDWVARGAEATQAAALAQLQAAFGAGRVAVNPSRPAQAPPPWSDQALVVEQRTEKRATFSCTPQLHRPEANVASRLLAAGDYIAGPFPATLESAVRSGQAAAKALLREIQSIR